MQDTTEQSTHAPVRRHSNRLAHHSSHDRNPHKHLSVATATDQHATHHMTVSMSTVVSNPFPHTCIRYLLALTLNEHIHSKSVIFITDKLSNTIQYNTSAMQRTLPLTIPSHFAPHQTSLHINTYTRLRKRFLLQQPRMKSCSIVSITDAKSLYLSVKSCLVMQMHNTADQKYT